MAESMVKRMALTLKAEIGYPADGDERPGEWMVEGGFRGDDFFDGIIKMLLCTMYNPTEAMKHSGFEAYLNSESGHEVEPVYQAMIVSALEEGR